MPELPEVETMCRGIRPVIGLRVAKVQQPPCSCRPCTIEPDTKEMHRSLVGRRVVNIERRGKRVMILFENGLRLVIEPRMSGLVLLADPPSVDHLRLQIDFAKADLASNAIQSVAERRETYIAQKNSCEIGPLKVWDRRGLGTIRLLDSDQYEHQIHRRLGEDALTISADALRERFGRSGRAIKVALLDQTAVAGVGNLYAAEILFVAGIDPRLRCDKLTGPQWSRLHMAINLVLVEAIAHEGSTLSDGTYRNTLNKAGGYQNMHRVYDRAGQLCRRCGDDTIRRIIQAQRSTFFCPNCQRRTGKHASVGENSRGD